MVLGDQYVFSENLPDLVRQQLTRWFGTVAQEWEHIDTLIIHHALPGQQPPTSNPYQVPQPHAEGIRICGEHQSLPGLLWALMSGEMTGLSLAESKEEIV